MTSLLLAMNHILGTRLDVKYIYMKQDKVNTSICVFSECPEEHPLNKDWRSD